MSEARVLMEDIVFGESPRWHDGRLWFSDWGAQQIVAVDPRGTREVVLDVDFPSFPMCFDFLPDGRMLVVSSSQSLLLSRERDGSLSSYADLGGLSQKPWNEVVVDGRGNAYVNGTGFDFPREEFAPGLIALVTPDGQVRQVADGVAFPNGMAITPDDRTLILAESYAERLTAFDIADDGSLGNRRVWADTEGDHPDGLCLDAGGGAWYADVGNRRCVRVREEGEVLQTIELDRGCFSCALGGDEGKTLFIVAQRWDPAGPADERTGQLLVADAPAPAAGWP